MLLSRPCNFVEPSHCNIIFENFLDSKILLKLSFVDRLDDLKANIWSFPSKGWSSRNLYSALYRNNTDIAL